MKCEDLFEEIINKYDKKFVQKFFTKQCYRSSKESYIVINNKRKKVSVTLFFENTYENDERIYADFVKTDGMIAWQLKTSESKADIKIIDIVIMMLKRKCYTRKEKRYFAKNMYPLFLGCNFEKFKNKYIK